jgi:hypothetical protein
MAAVVQAGRFSIWLLVVNFNISFLIGLQFQAERFPNAPPNAKPSRWAQAARRFN